MIHPNAYFDRLIVVDEIEELQPRVISTDKGLSSVSVVCPKCGNVWAKVLALKKNMAAPEPELTPFRAVLGLCEACEGGSLLACGLINPRYPRVGRQVITREYEIEIKRLQKRKEAAA